MSSNLSHYGAVLEAVKRYEGVTAIMRLFTLIDDQGIERRLRVDLVTNGGKQWVKGHNDVCKNHRFIKDSSGSYVVKAA